MSDFDCFLAYLMSVTIENGMQYIDILCCCCKSLYYN